MFLLRMILILAVLLAAYVAVALASAFPMLWLLYIALFVAAHRKAAVLTAYGTARWADADDLEELTNG